MSELKCEICGKEEVGLGWPTPTLCMECGRKRDMTEPKPCPFCGNAALLQDGRVKCGSWACPIQPQTRTYYESQIQRAIGEWNQRA
jgi:hypothetical protein